MNHLQRLGNKISVSIPADETGFTGRECPSLGCEGYFKIQFGTGLKGENLPCHCPYCGHTAMHDQFWTTGQIEYAKSIAVRQFADAFYQDLKNLEFDQKPSGSFGIGLSMKITRNGPTPVRYYREERLETEVTCSRCTLRYSVYGVFAFCPDCGQHNSFQILDKNLEVVGKMLDLATSAEKELAERLIENALEDCVSAFDGFGRELCRVYKENATDTAKAEKATFQSLAGASSAIQTLFGLDLSAQLTADEWRLATLGFQKRHLFAHRMGVVDKDYITKTDDTQAVVGRKVDLGADQVWELVRIIRKLALGFSGDLQAVGKRRK